MKINVPTDRSEKEQLEWLEKAFTKIVDACEVKKLKKIEVDVDYGGEITSSSGKKIPCIKTWTLKEIKKWLDAKKAQ